MSRPAALEKRLGHRFAAVELLQQALTHRSYGPENNERLEFLGDGVLGCAVADELYARFPQLSEGKLTRLRASLVREETLAEVAEHIGDGGTFSSFPRLAASGATHRVSRAMENFPNTSCFPPMARSCTIATIDSYPKSAIEVEES